jgi:anti-anti-sigma factor
MDIVLDFDQCSYMSSAGLREIVHALKRIRQLNGRMCSKPIPFTIAIVFETSGLERILKCEDE